MTREARWRRTIEERERCSGTATGAARWRRSTGGRRRVLGGLVRNAPARNASDLLKLELSNSFFVAISVSDHG